jgi:hypothetical protein
MMTHGCKGGKVTMSAETKNLKTGEMEHRESTLTENRQDQKNSPGTYPSWPRSTALGA